MSLGVAGLSGVKVTDAAVGQSGLSRRTGHMDQAIDN